MNKAVEKGDLKGTGVSQMMIATATSKIEKLRRDEKVRNKSKLLENKLESKSRSSTARKEKKYRQGKGTIIEQEKKTLKKALLLKSTRVIR